MGSFHVAFSATRRPADVRFPCSEQAGRTFYEHEPSVVAPGESFDYERAIDCALSLPGTYDVVVSARVEGSPWERIDAFPLRLVASGESAPRAHPSRPGLWATMAGNPYSPQRRATVPLPPLLCV